MRGFVTEQHYSANVECEMEYVCLCMEEAGGSGWGGKRGGVLVALYTHVLVHA